MYFWKFCLGQSNTIFYPMYILNLIMTVKSIEQ